MPSAMKMDVIAVHWTLILSLVALVALLVALIVGAAGLNRFQQTYLLF